LLFSLLITCVVALLATTALIIALGHRIRVTSRVMGLLSGLAVAAVSGEVAAQLWSLPPQNVVIAQCALVLMTVVVVIARPQWNPVGQVFFASFLASGLIYLALAAYITVAGSLSAVGMAASALLFCFELIALFLSASFAFEGCDALCRKRWHRVISEPDPTYLPFVSLQVPAYNEPPDMLIQTIQSLEAIDYPNLEIVVIDNNTEDPETWHPVEEYCRDKPRVKFVHAIVEGFKAGALNLVMREHMDPQAEIIGVVDADYLVEPDYLKRVVGYFADSNIAFVQTPQDYREFEGDAYLTACYDAYNYFFRTSMPSRDERNSIIFAGTMGLIRRSALGELGGWGEECITEDAETSLRLLKAGYSGLYIARSFGRGIMPLTFASFKAQRFRWALGGIQILRMHWRELLPWPRDPSNHLTTAQRLDYFLGSFQWMNDLVYLGFTVVLLVTAGLVMTQGGVELRPLVGAVVLLPAALIVTGLIRALWSLRQRTGIGLKRSVLAFANWLSVSWTVARACLQGLISGKAAFLRTPKVSERQGLLDAFRAARMETLLTIALWGSGAAIALSGRGTTFLFVLFAWQGFVYATATFMSWLNVHTELSAQLERRRRTEHLRNRLATLAPVGAAAAGVVLVGAVAALLAVGGSNPGRQPANPFDPPQTEASESSPFEFVTNRLPVVGGDSPTRPGDESSPAPEESPAESPGEQESPAPSPSPSPAETPTPDPSPSPTEEATPQ
jgi:glycosyltransferase involved in cell wall biosynthesis